MAAEPSASADHDDHGVLEGAIALTDEDYEIVSVEPADPARNLPGAGWCCYVIEQGKNTIRGYRRGDLAAVRQAVEEIVAGLNERRAGKGGRVHLRMSSQAKMAKPQ